MQNVMKINFTGLEPPAICELSLTQARDLCGALEKVIPEARACNGSLSMSFPHDGGEIVLTLTPDRAENYLREWQDIVAREEMRLRGVTHPIGRVDIITRDEHGEMTKVETRYKF